MTPLWMRNTVEHLGPGVWWLRSEPGSGLVEEVFLSDADIIALFDAIKANHWCFRRPETAPIPSLWAAAGEEACGYPGPLGMPCERVKGHPGVCSVRWGTLWQREDGRGEPCDNRSTVPGATKS